MNVLSAIHTQHKHIHDVFCCIQENGHSRWNQRATYTYRFVQDSGKQAYSDNSPDCSSQHPSTCSSQTPFNKIQTIFPDWQSSLVGIDFGVLSEQGSPATLHVSCTKWAVTHRYGKIQPAALIPEERTKQVFGHHVLLELLYRSCVHGPVENRGLLQPLYCPVGKILLWWWQFGSPALEVIFLSSTHTNKAINTVLPLTGLWSYLWNLLPQLQEDRVAFEQNRHIARHRSTSYMNNHGTVYTCHLLTVTQREDDCSSSKVQKTTCRPEFNMFAIYASPSCTSSYYMLYHEEKKKRGQTKESVCKNKSLS